MFAKIAQIPYYYLFKLQFYDREYGERSLLDLTSEKVNCLLRLRAISRFSEFFFGNWNALIVFTNVPNKPKISPKAHLANFGIPAQAAAVCIGSAVFGWIRLILHRSLRKNTLKGLGWPKKLWLGILLRSTYRKENGDHNGEKIMRNKNREESHRRHFVKFPAAALPGFAGVFWPIGRFFCSDLAMCELKIEFHAKGEAFTFFSSRKGFQCRDRWRRSTPRRLGRLLRRGALATRVRVWCGWGLFISICFWFVSSIAFDLDCPIAIK